MMTQGEAITSMQEEMCGPNNCHGEVTKYTSS